MFITCLEHITAYEKKIPKFAKWTAQAVERMITNASHNKLLQNIKDSYKTTMLAITIVTITKDHTNHSRQVHTANRNVQNYPGMQKLNDKYEESDQSHASGTHDNRDN